MNPLFHRRWSARVEEHTREARGKFVTAPNHLDRDLPDRTYWVSVLVEEVGKLARCCNKLAIIPRHQVSLREPWDREGNQRLLTIASMVRRMAERWPEIPDQLAGTWHIGEVNADGTGTPGSSGGTNG